MNLVVVLKHDKPLQREGSLLEWVELLAAQRQGVLLHFIVFLKLSQSLCGSPFRCFDEEALLKVHNS